METSIAPRQRPKAGQAQPQPITGILPIQPALTPRKRPNMAAGAPQAIGISSSVIRCVPFLLGNMVLRLWSQLSC